jgi:hypothetical protein
MQRVSDLRAGTAGTGRVHPRWVGRVRVRVDDFFFKTVPYPSHTRASRGYHGYGYGVLRHTGRRVGNGTGRRVKRYNGLLNRYNDGYAGTGTGGGRRVNEYGYNGFFPKKN